MSKITSDQASSLALMATLGNVTVVLDTYAETDDTYNTEVEELATQVRTLGIKILKEVETFIKD